MGVALRHGMRSGVGHRPSPKHGNTLYSTNSNAQAKVDDVGDMFKPSGRDGGLVWKCSLRSGVVVPAYLMVGV